MEGLGEELVGVVVKEVFSSIWEKVSDTPKWITENLEKSDPFGQEAKLYSNFVVDQNNNMNVYGMHRPIPLKDIYINVRILDMPKHRRRLNVDELNKKITNDFNEDISNEEYKIWSGSQIVSSFDHVLVLGRPGAGKTTFLKHLALEAISGRLGKKLIPINITLRYWIESTLPLEQFIIDQFKLCNLSQPVYFVNELLHSGKCLILLDGYDEVESAKDFVNKQINLITNKYKNNKFILSCRTAANEHVFDKFSEVEVADFNDEQIQAFINKWFPDGVRASKCWRDLANPENVGIKKLAKTPLLATLICLAYDEKISFPPNRAELYQDAVDALLKKWDSSRSISRDNPYRMLTTRRKEVLFSRIAAGSFENKNIYIKKSDLLREIDLYMNNLSPEYYDCDSEDVLNTIEAHHGMLVREGKNIYAFSHLTFQEFFAAKYLSEYIDESRLLEFVDKNLYNKSWIEIIILTSTLLSDSSRFLMKIREKVTQIHLLGSTKQLFVRLESILNEKAPYPSPVKRVLALRYFLQELSLSPEPSEYKWIISLLDQLVTELFYSYKLYVDPGVSEIQTLNLGLSKNRAEIKELMNGSQVISSKESLRNLGNYLYASRIFIKCILADCYVDKNLRSDLINNFLVEA